MNLGAQLGPLSITKLSPNWACQMGPIHFINFLLSGSETDKETETSFPPLTSVSRSLLELNPPPVLRRSERIRNRIMMGIGVNLSKILGGLIAFLLPLPSPPVPEFFYM